MHLLPTGDTQKVEINVSSQLTLQDAAPKRLLTLSVSRLGLHTQLVHRITSRFGMELRLL